MEGCAPIVADFSRHESSSLQQAHFLKAGVDVFGVVDQFSDWIPASVDQGVLSRLRDVNREIGVVVEHAGFFDIDGNLRLGPRR